MAPHLLTASDSPILLSVDDEIAVITFNTPAKKNALSLELYKLFATLLRKVDALEAVVATVVSGGACDFFSVSGNSDCGTNEGRERSLLTRTRLHAGWGGREGDAR